jgi:tetratricopeptide (TPR) repeat protein
MLEGIELIDWSNKEEVIKYYEANKLYFDNYQAQTHPDSILNIIDIKLSYCNALISKHHYTDCLEILTHVNIMLNKLEKDKTIDSNKRYERYLFIEGVVLGYLKRYEESQTNFKELLHIDSRNDLYKDWFKSNRIKIISKRSGLVGYTGFGIVMLLLILDVVFKIKLSKYLDLGGFIIMISGFSFPYILNRIKKIK